jgi:Mlc titration factor MtfA (ptsG expression regulator)
MTTETLFALLAVAVIAWAGYIYNQKIKRRKLLASQLSPQHIQILRDHVPLYNRLPRHLQKKLQGLIFYFLDDKAFVGCDGFVINDEVRLIIAANACLLILNREKHYFPGFQTILVYPDTYMAADIHYDGLVETHHQSARAGESWHRGPVVLSWADVMRGASGEEDGHNVVLHEFAHKLDEENVAMDGLPVLRDRESYQQWAEVLSREYDAFKNRVAHGENQVIDEYGAVSAAEFFAVCTESFFEKPKQMKKKLPQLYQQFQQFYGLDPAAW